MCTLELYGKSHPKLQFVYSKRKVSTKLFYAPKRNEKNLDQSMRQPIRDHCTLRESSHHCPHHFPTRIPMLLPYLGWATMASRRNKCVSHLLNLIPKERIKVKKTPVYFLYNSIIQSQFTIVVLIFKIYLKYNIIESNHRGLKCNRFVILF